MIIYYPVKSKKLIKIHGTIQSKAITVILAFLFLVGCQSDTRSFLIIGVVEEESAGALAGIEIGDIVIEVNGKTPESWNNFNFIAESNINKPLSLLVKRGIDTVSLTLTPQQNQGQAFDL